MCGIFITLFSNIFDVPNNQVMPYGFIKEFVEREKKWLKSGGKFIVPYPNLKIVN